MNLQMSTLDDVQFYLFQKNNTNSRCRKQEDMMFSRLISNVTALKKHRQGLDLH